MYVYYGAWVLQKVNAVYTDTFLWLFAQRRTIARQPGSEILFKLSTEVNNEVERAMQEDNETTANQLHQLFTQHGFNYSAFMLRMQL